MQKFTQSEVNRLFQETYSGDIFIDTHELMLYMICIAPNKLTLKKVIP